MSALILNIVWQKTYLIFVPGLDLQWQRKRRDKGTYIVPMVIRCLPMLYYINPSLPDPIMLMFPDVPKASAATVDLILRIVDYIFTYIGKRICIYVGL